MNRIIWIVIDSVGIGALPDAKAFGDEGVNTLGHIVKEFNDIKIPNMIKLGLGNIDGIDYINSIDSPIGSFGRCNEVSQGKDTTTGHWEMTGLLVDTPFKTFKDGFPKEIIDEFERRTGRKVVANKPASGTAILDEFGEQQMKTGDVIVYTSADSVPYVGPCKGQFERTSNRRDYSLNPFDKTVLDNIKENGLDVIGVGKIEDIFNGQGISEAIHTKDNMDGVDQTINYIKKDNKGLIFTNLVDFDSKYGHRRNIKGYKEALEEFDARIPEIIESMNEKDILIINADHGNDPAYKGTDHTREYIPLLVYGKDIKEGINLGTRKSFADIGATVADILNVSKTKNGTSFKEEVMK